MFPGISCSIESVVTDCCGQGSAVGAVDDKHTRFKRLNLFQGTEGLL
jgi:hypothetical protein